METVEYDGPLYLYETNIEKEKAGKEIYIESTTTAEDETLYIRRGNRL